MKLYGLWLCFLLVILMAVDVKSQGPSNGRHTDFRIDIDLYEDEKKPPVSNIKTIFTDGKYIELDDHLSRVTIVDPGQGSITILDSLKKSRVQLEMVLLENQLNSILQKMTDEDRQKFVSDGDPKRDADNLFVIGNERLQYKFRAVKPANENIAICYADFANWSVRINALFNKTPPFLRMQLNQLLMDQRQLPAELRRITIVAAPTSENPQGKTKEIVARLIVTESLSTDDRTRVAAVMQSISEFKIVSDKEFFR